MSRKDPEPKGVVMTRREALGGAGAGLIAAVLLPQPAAEAAPFRTLRAVSAGGLQVKPIARCQHTTTVLPNGCILVAGGFHRGPLSAVQIYDPARGAWFAAASLPTPRARHAAVALGDGRVLVVGGHGAVPLATADIYYPGTDQWVPGAPMPSPREQASAALLPNGRVLVHGGFHQFALSEGLVYDPVSNTWQSLD